MNSKHNLPLPLFPPNPHPTCSRCSNTSTSEFLGCPVCSRSRSHIGRKRWREVKMRLACASPLRLYKFRACSHNHLNKTEANETARVLLPAHFLVFLAWVTFEARGFGREWIVAGFAFEAFCFLSILSFASQAASRSLSASPSAPYHTSSMGSSSSSSVSCNVLEDSFDVLVTGVELG